ncbi:hypothetical protein EMPG_13492 [Blastomyces silverae]|uniref:Uncharacterized protein n=1 Tax=Blastomyces silverae TaxID=2060906 RepID=A0A0H1BI61_9EURO|nr:hypothetical protein EMPG_13492 [Blastomyces silverae]
MWLFRGAQSAVFYYATCTPCASSKDRRRRRKDAARTHREPVLNNANNDLVTDQPPAIVFQQPVPFSTNSYWEEEIALGPGPPARRAGRRNTNNSHNNNNNNHKKNGKNGKNGKKRKKNHAAGSRGSSSTDSPTIAGATAQTLSQESTLQNGMGVIAGAVSGVLEDLVPSRKELGDRWNRIRYQREDEELWGGGGGGGSASGSGTGEEVKGSSIGLSGRGRADTGSSAKYYVARNPAINDLHPPVVCGPVSRAETRWMLQPPPSAKVMEGKVRSTPSVSARDGRFGSFERVAVSGRNGNGNQNTEKGEGASASPQRRQRLQQMQRQGDGQLDGCYCPHLSARIEQHHHPLRDSLRSSRRRDKPPLIHMGSDHIFSLPPLSTEDVVLVSPRPGFASVTTGSKHAPTHPDHHHHHNNTNNTSSVQPSSAPPPSWQWPWKPIEDSKQPPPLPQSQPQSRPTSKATADSGKAFSIQQHQPEKLHTAWPSSTLDIALKPHELVRSVQVEVSSPETAYFYDIDDDDDDDYDGDYEGCDCDGNGEKQLGMRRHGPAIRPWRWSMDI